MELVGDLSNSPVDDWRLKQLPNLFKLREFHLKKHNCIYNRTINYNLYLAYKESVSIEANLWTISDRKLLILNKKTFRYIVNNWT